jgi:hypothetical protein
MDPFTDMLSGYLYGTVSPVDIYYWLQEWAEYGADAQYVCRVTELGSSLCNWSVRFSYGLAYLLGFLTI